MLAKLDEEKKVPIAYTGDEDVDYQQVQLQDIDHAAEKRVLRKIDLVVLPMVCVHSRGVENSPLT